MVLADVVGDQLDLCALGAPGSRSTGAANAIIYDWARTPNDTDIAALESALAALAVTLLAD